MITNQMVNQEEQRRDQKSAQSTHCQEDAHTDLGQRPGSQTVTSFFSGKNKRVSPRSTPLTSLSQRWEEATSNCSEEETTALPWGCPEQTSRHLATFMRFMVTTIVYSRLFDFLSTSTFGALRRNHIVSKAFETIAVVHMHMRSAFLHELSRTHMKSDGKCISVGVDALAVMW